MDWMAVLVAAVKAKILVLAAQEIPHQHRHLKVAMAALVVLLLAAEVVAAAVLLLLELLQQARLAALVARAQPQVLLGHPSHMAAAAAVETNHLVLVVLAVLAVVAQGVQMRLELRVQPTSAVVAVEAVSLEAIQALLAAQVAPVS